MTLMDIEIRNKTRSDQIVSSGEVQEEPSSKATTDDGGLGHVMANALVSDSTGWGEKLHCVGEVPCLGEELLISSLSICNQMEMKNRVNLANHIGMVMVGEMMMRQPTQQRQRLMTLSFM